MVFSLTKHDQFHLRVYAYTKCVLILRVLISVRVIRTTAWFQREGRSLLIPCLVNAPADDEKYAKASYLWRDGHGKGMLKSGAMIFGNGSLYLKHLQARDTDTYYCDVFVPDETVDSVIHNVIGIIRVLRLISVVKHRLFVPLHYTIQPDNL